MARKLNFMVGDYVLIDGKPRRIDAVHQKKVGWHSVHYKMNWARFGVIEPIPLTAEILEKNGFAYDEDGSNFDRIYMKNDDGNLVVDITGEDSFVGFVCKYVHQLQHALRLCGISKEIELNFE